MSQYLCIAMLAVVACGGSGPTAAMWKNAPSSTSAIGASDPLFGQNCNNPDSPFDQGCGWFADSSAATLVRCFFPGSDQSGLQTPTTPICSVIKAPTSDPCGAGPGIEWQGIVNAGDVALRGLTVTQVGTNFRRYSGEAPYHCGPSSAPTGFAGVDVLLELGPTGEPFGTINSSSTGPNSVIRGGFILSRVQKPDFALTTQGTSADEFGKLKTIPASGGSTSWQVFATPFKNSGISTTLNWTVTGTENVPGLSVTITPSSTPIDGNEFHPLSPNSVLGVTINQGQGTPSGDYTFVMKATPVDPKIEPRSISLKLSVTADTPLCTPGIDCPGDPGPGGGGVGPGCPPGGCTPPGN